METDDRSDPNAVLRLLVESQQPQLDKTKERIATPSREHVEGIDDDLLKIMARRSHDIPITDNDLEFGATRSITRVGSIDFSRPSPPCDTATNNASVARSGHPSAPEGTDSSPKAKNSSVSAGGDACLPGAYSGAPGSGYGRIERVPLPRYMLGDKSKELTKDVAEDLEEPPGGQETDPQEEPSTTTENKLSLRNLVFASSLLCIALAAILATVFFLRDKGTGNKSTPTLVDKSQPAILVLELSQHSLGALQDPDSYQSEAYRWVKEDPNWDDYPSWRQQQRFAMACVYFALQGAFWGKYAKADSYMLYFGHVDRPEWLSYDKEECTWQSSTYDTCFSNGRLRALDFTGYEKLKGFLPPEVSMLSHLEIIDFSTCNLCTDLESILPLGASDSLPFLRELKLSESCLIGTIPTSLGNLISLQHLDLSGNSLTSTLPTDLALLTELAALDLSQNQLSGRVPEQLGELPLLTEFSVDSNTDIEHSIPDGFCQGDHVPMDLFVTDWCGSVLECCI